MGDATWRNLADARFLRFVMAGAVNTVLTLLVFVILQHLMPYLWAYSLTYALGIGFSYLLNVRFVFRRSTSLRSFTLFPLVYVAQYLLGAVILWGPVEQLALSPILGMIAVVVIAIPVTFVLSRAILLGQSA